MSSQRLDVRAQCLRVCRQLGAASRFGVLSALINGTRPQVCIHRGLRVEREEPLPGQVNRHVGTAEVTRRCDRAQASSLSERANRTLLREVHVRHHSGSLQDTSQLDLTPRAACATRPQSSLQGGGRASQLGFAPRGLAQLLGEGTVLTRANLLHLINPLCHLLQLRSDGCERLQDGSIAL